ncbi:hypothetical protein EDB81DRAFT_222621 [Dactylonectria macrodidyma]|uniref:Uncharacterized protein n=1 Tax=Dactylonectria macrodidyma TaxID=307937 RepID=A0A9P9IKP9_9HYPO|nr:hypothetical protein EDB81DRAFT_222621 [Dactylonectria macrodidyma]
MRGSAGGECGVRGGDASEQQPGPRSVAPGFSDTGQGSTTQPARASNKSSQAQSVSLDSVDGASSVSICRRCLDDGSSEVRERRLDERIVLSEPGCAGESEAKTKKGPGQKRRTEEEQGQQGTGGRGSVAMMYVFGCFSAPKSIVLVESGSGMEGWIESPVPTLSRSLASSRWPTNQPSVQPPKRVALVVLVLFLIDPGSRKGNLKEKKEGKRAGSGFVFGHVLLLGVDGGLVPVCWAVLIHRLANQPTG